jgi:hypothetical protein
MFKTIISQETSQTAMVTNQINGDNMDNIRFEADRHVRNKKREYLGDKINETTASTKSNNIINYIEAQLNLRRVTNVELTW